jgi:hypothetical protein
MPALNIYQVNAWNLGTVADEPWRSKASAFCRRAATALAWLSRLFTPQRVAIGTAFALAMLVAHLAGAHAPHATHGVVLAAAVTPSATLREKREKLIKDAGDLMGANNTFENDDKRSAFDKVMVDIKALGSEIEDAERAEQLDTLSRQSLPETQRTNPRQDETPEKALYERALGNSTSAASTWAR